MKTKSTISTNLTGASIWVSSENGSYKLADCDAVIEIPDQTQMLKLLGSDTEYAVKSYSTALAICSGMKYAICENVSVELLKTVQSFSLKFESSETCIYGYKVHVNKFNNIIPTEINLNGKWRFDITAHLNAVKGMFPDSFFNEL